MENKINIAELLRNCPKGMELDCTMFDDNCVEFSDIVDNKFLPIRCRVKHSDGGYNVYNFTKYGCWIDDNKAKCVIFPKGKTSWEGFQRPFKDGDIICVYNDGVNENFYYKYIAIFKEIKDNCIYVHGLYSYNDKIFSIHQCLCEIKDYTKIKFTTKEEKQKLFQAIKDNGYKWNAETKTLEKLIEPKFKVGDRIKHIVGKEEIATVVSVEKLHYNLDSKVGTSSFSISLQREWELIPNKFDINTLVPFESKVLIRNDENQRWLPAFWGYKVVDGFITTFGWCKYCIPYEGNEILFKTNNDCDDFYKTWEK